MSIHNLKVFQYKFLKDLVQGFCPQDLSKEHQNFHQFQFH